jgi:hypothetical protein
MSVTDFSFGALNEGLHLVQVHCLIHPGSRAIRRLEGRMSGRERLAIRPPLQALAETSDGPASVIALGEPQKCQRPDLDPKDFGVN